MGYTFFEPKSRRTTLHSRYMPSNNLVRKMSVPVDQQQQKQQQNQEQQERLPMSSWVKSIAKTHNQDEKPKFIHRNVMRPPRAVRRRQETFNSRVFDLKSIRKQHLIDMRSQGLLQMSPIQFMDHRKLLKVLSHHNGKSISLIH